MLPPEDKEVTRRQPLPTVWAVLSWRDARDRLHAKALPLIEAKSFLERLQAENPGCRDVRIEFFR